MANILSIVVNFDSCQRPSPRTGSATSEDSPEVRSRSTGDCDDGEEVVMLDRLASGSLAQQLLDVARDPMLRHSVYLRLGEYCHLCRNRLNSLKLSLFLAMKQSNDRGRRDWGLIELQYLELERIVDRVQTICRPMTLCRVTIALDLLFEDRREEWSRLIAAGGGELEWHRPRVRGLASFDVERMGQALDALVYWRAGDCLPDRVARLRWWVESGTAHISWEESDSSPIRPSGDGPTWTLPLIARVLEAHGGDFRVTAAKTWRLDLTWPASTDTH
jgi:hypothetical protein